MTARTTLGRAGKQLDFVHGLRLSDSAERVQIRRGSNASEVALERQVLISRRPSKASFAPAVPAQRLEPRVNLLDRIERAQRSASVVVAR
jgi:hypothetical protein